MATGKVVPLNQPYPAQKPDVVTTFDHLTASAISARTNPDSLVGQRGLAIYSKMANDEQVKAVTTFKRDAITARGWQFAFRPSTKLSQQEQEQRQGLFEEMLARMHGNFSDALNTIMTGRLFGFSMTEKVYGEMEVDGKQWPAINRLLGRDPLSFRFYTDEFGMLVRTEQQTRNGLQDVDMRRVIHYVHAPEWDQVYGRSDLREAYRSWYIKDQVSNLWPLYLERFAAGFVHVELPAGETLADEELTALKAAVTRVKSLGSLVTPPGVKVTVVFPGTTDAYESAVQFHDLAIAKALLVPNLLGISHTGQTGAYSQSQTQLEAFFWTLNADATRLEECLNEQLFRDLGDQCWGDGDYPVFRFKPASLEHTKWVLGTWKDLLGVKAVVPTEEDEAFIRKLMEMPARDEKSTPLVNPVEEQHRKEDMKAQADALAQTLEAKKQQPAPGKQTFAWDEKLHPRNPAGTDANGDGKGDGGKFAPGTGVTLPPKVLAELRYHEVENHDPANTDPDKLALIEQLKAGKVVRGEGALRALRRALDNVADIAEDNGQGALKRAAATLRDSIKFSWDESKHPRNAAGSGDVTGDGKGDGGKFAPKARGAVSAKKPSEMSAAAINKELDKLDAEDTKVTDALIEAGRGHERPSDMQGKDDPLSKRFWELIGRRKELTTEIEARTGQRMHRLPKGFGPIKKFSVAFTSTEERDAWLAALRVGSVLVVPERVAFSEARYEGLHVDVVLPGYEADTLPAGAKLRFISIGHEDTLGAEVLPA